MQLLDGLPHELVYLVVIACATPLLADAASLSATGPFLHSIAWPFIKKRIDEHRDTLLQLGASIGGRSAAFTRSAFRYSRVLTNLDLSCSVPFGNKGAIALASALRVSGVNAVLTELRLGVNGIGDEGAKALASGLRVNGVLKSLNLRLNDIRDEGAAAIADALAVNGVLTELDLSYNDIEDTGAEALASALRVNAVLTTLDLGGNYIRAEGAAAIAEALRGNGVLTTLDLCANDFGDEGKRVLRDAVSERIGFEFKV